MTLPRASFTTAASGLVAPTAIAAVAGVTLTDVTSEGFGGVGSVVVPPAPEHTARTGNNAHSHALRAKRFATANMLCMISLTPADGPRSSVNWRLPGNKMPPRHRQPLVGFAGGSASVAVFCDSPVALRHRLSTALL